MHLIQDWEFAEQVHLDNKGSKELKVINENNLS